MVTTKGEYCVLSSLVDFLITFLFKIYNNKKIPLFWGGEEEASQTHNTKIKNRARCQLDHKLVDDSLFTFT